MGDRQNANRVDSACVFVEFSGEGGGLLPKLTSPPFQPQSPLRKQTSSIVGCPTDWKKVLHTFKLRHAEVGRMEFSRDVPQAGTQENRGHSDAAKLEIKKGSL